MNGLNFSEPQYDSVSIGKLFEQIRAHYSEQNRDSETY
jgi:hypothetical protein